MSFLAKFYLDDKEYNVLECSYALHQPRDGEGRPTGRPKGGQIKLVLESDSDTNLFHWMREPAMTKSGSVVFFKNDAMAHQKVLEFENAFCLDLIERFISDNREPMKTTVVISAQSIKMNGVDFNNLWGTN